MWDQLPRDLVLKIVKQLDIDTRIKLGIVVKMRVPENIKNNLTKVLSPPHDESDIYTTRSVGTNKRYGFFKYAIFYNKHPSLKPKWMTHHFDNSMLHVYYLNKDNTWVYKRTQV